jgi:hypothetical protein
LQSHCKKKIVFKKFPTLSKNRKPDTQPRQKSIRQTTATDDIKMIVSLDGQERQPVTSVTVAQHHFNFI